MRKPSKDRVPLPHGEHRSPAGSGHWPLLLRQPPPHTLHLGPSWPLSASPEAQPLPAAEPLFLLFPWPAFQAPLFLQGLSAQVRRVSLLCTCIHLHIPPSSNNSHHRLASEPRWTEHSKARDPREKKHVPWGGHQTVCRNPRFLDQFMP